jgi:hypothetical protein
MQGGESRRKWLHFDVHLSDAKAAAKAEEVIHSQLSCGVFLHMFVTSHVAFAGLREPPQVATLDVNLSEDNTPMAITL